jgi:hypothetical protein
MTGKSGVLTDEQWEELLRKGSGLGLTNEMRVSIDWLIQGLKFDQELDKDRLNPRDLRKTLTALAKRVERLAKELDRPQIGLAILAAEESPPPKTTQWTAELVGTPPPMRDGRQPKKVSITFFTFTKYLGQLPERLRQAATQVQPGKRHDADYRRGFLKILDVLLHYRMSQSDKWYEFLGAVYEIAGCDVGEDSIKNDIEWVQKKRPTTIRRSPPRRSA